MVTYDQLTRVPRSKIVTRHAEAPLSFIALK